MKNSNHLIQPKTLLRYQENGKIAGTVLRFSETKHTQKLTNCHRDLYANCKICFQPVRNNAKLGHFRRMQNIFVFKTCFPYSADVKPTVNKNWFDFF